MFHLGFKVNHSSGFTLIELLVSVVIIAIVAGIGGANYLTSLKRGNDGKRAADLNNLRNALEMYYLDGNCGGAKCYPDTSDSWQIANNALSVLMPDYMKVLPVDPKSGQSYYYSSDGDCYCLSARMETDNNYRTSIGSCTCPDPQHVGECYLVTCP